MVIPLSLDKISGPEIKRQKINLVVNFNENILKDKK